MDLAAAILHAADVLDPFRQANCWPDPIEHDGRPLPEQARDALALLEADDDFGTVNGDPKYAEAAKLLREALATHTTIPTSPR